jgi:hypothetical protein
MATIINADTSNGLKLTSDTSGEIELQSAGTTIATVDSTGIAMATGKTIQNASGDVVTNTPAFSVKLSANQNISETTLTKIQYDTTEFDTDSAFDTSNYKFTVPSGKAGLYLFSSTARLDSGANANLVLGQLFLYKNGAAYKRSYDYFTTSNIRSYSAMVTATLDLSVGDYIEMYGLINSVDNTGGTISSLTYTHFSGHKLIT